MFTDEDLLARISAPGPTRVDSLTIIPRGMYKITVDETERKPDNGGNIHVILSGTAEDVITKSVTPFRTDLLLVFASDSKYHEANEAVLRGIIKAGGTFGPNLTLQKPITLVGWFDVEVNKKGFENQVIYWGEKEPTKKRVKPAVNDATDPPPF